VTGVEAHQARIDSIIEDISENWSLSRMPLVDRSILRLAVWEMLYRDDDVPDSVAINEAVEMAKVYGGEDSSKFINGILGRLADVAAAGGAKEDTGE
jgi:N utilization substance protein B